MPGAVEIRSAATRDVEAICSLLTQGFGASPAMWRSMLAYPWLPAYDKPDLGGVIDADGEVVGFLGAMYSNRVINGAVVRVCNVFAWYVRPDYRRYAVSLLSFVVRRPGLAFVNVTPADHVVPIFQRAGFVLADEERLICKPDWSSAIRRRSLVERVPDNDIKQDLLGRLDYQIYQDHIGRSVRQVVLSAGNEVCLLITKRMYWPQVRFPRTDLYYVSNPEFLARHFDRVLLNILLREKTVALHADPRQLASIPRRASKIAATALYPSATLIKSAEVPPAAMDRLYSELVILP